MLGFIRRQLRHLRKRHSSYTPLIEVRVSKDAILHNLDVFRGLGKPSVVPVLKSNAYGHGLIEVAEILDDQRLPFLCVDSYFEALILRNEGIQTPILFLGYTPLENILNNHLSDVAFGILSLEELAALAEGIRTPVNIHLKLDTGMHRHGVTPHDIDAAIAILKSHPSIVLEGVYSHFADADTADSVHAKKQIEAWNGTVARFKKEFPALRYTHLAATSGAYFNEKIDANVMRLGIGLYGFNVSLKQLELRPALEMTARISSVRTIAAGEQVGYNATFTATEEMRVATIPVGYTEGLDRRLSSKGSVTVCSTSCPIIGRVSMNITSVDVSDVPDVRIDEPVTVISAKPSDPNSIESMARVCGTIPYELLVRIPAHLRRVVY